MRRLEGVLARVLRWVLTFLFPALSTSTQSHTLEHCFRASKTLRRINSNMQNMIWFTLISSFSSTKLSSAQKSTLCFWAHSDIFLSDHIDFCISNLYVYIILVSLMTLKWLQRCLDMWLDSMRYCVWLGGPWYEVYIIWYLLFMLPFEANRGGILCNYWSLLCLSFDGIWLLIMCFLNHNWNLK